MPQEVSNGHARSEFSFPLFENSREEPSWQFVGPACHRSVIHADSQKLIGKSDRAGNPIGDSVIAGEAAIPIEICGTSFDCHCNITKPERPACSMSKHVDAQNAQVIFRTQQPHLDAVQIYQVRMLV